MEPKIKIVAGAANPIVVRAGVRQPTWFEGTVKIAIVAGAVVLGGCSAGSSPVPVAAAAPQEFSSCTDAQTAATLGEAHGRTVQSVVGPITLARCQTI